MYLLVPASNSHTIPDELAHIQSWATSNNLRLNQSKSAELIVKKPRAKIADPTVIATLPRVLSLKVLGVTLQSNFSMAEHVNNIITKAGQTTYALKLVKSNGLALKYLTNITRSTLFSAITYASPAWVGFANDEDLTRLQGPFKRALKWGLISPDLGRTTSFQSVCDQADATLFDRILSMGGHVLRSLLPPQQTHTHHLRTRSHNYVLPPTSAFLKKNFFHRMLYKTAGVKSKQS
jgi:hypothetical protein